MPSGKGQVYVYGIVRLDPGRSLVDRFDNQGFPACGLLRTIACDRLAALGSALPAPDGGSFEQALQDTARARDMVLNHHRVLEGVMGQCTVLPLRFGAVFADEGAVKAVLEKHRDALDKALDRIDGALEWGLKVYCDRKRLERWLAAEAAAIRDLQQQVADVEPGKAFFLRRRLARAVGEEVERAVDRCLTAAEERVRAVARDVAALRIQSPEVHGRPDEMVCNRAYLVDRDAEGRLLSLVGELRSAHAPPGFDFETSGPWPPYSFADCRLEGADRAA